MLNHLFTTFVQKITSMIDWVWPIVTPKSLGKKQEQETKDTERKEADLKAIDNLLEHSIETTKKAHEAVLGMLNKEMERVQTAENKLATLFVLSTISASLVLSVNGLASEGTHWLILLVTFYCFMQLVRILLATLSGLKRRAYSALNIANIAPSWTDTDTKHLVQIVRTETKNIHEYQQAGNEKITALAIAYTAFRNYLCGLALLFLVSILFSPEQETLEIKTQKIIYELQRHPHILESLRSPPSPGENIDPSGLQETPSPKENMGSLEQRELRDSQ